MLKLIVLVFFVCFVTSAVGVNEYPESRVANGREAGLGDFPYQISLKRPHSRIRRLYTTNCGASIIGERKVLSAGHCFVISPEGVCDKCRALSNRQVAVSNVYAVAGTLRTQGWYQRDSEGTEQWRAIHTALTPSDYEFPNSDIAIAFTKDPFVFNYYVWPVPWAARRVDYGDMMCRVSGYGRISASESSETLLWADLELIPSSECSGLHYRNMDKFICTSSDYASVLKGDSGCPLLCRNTTDPKEDERGVVVGVVSGLRIGSGVFFTRVSSYKDFVDQDYSAVATWRGTPCVLFAFIIVLLVSFLFYSRSEVIVD